MDWFVPQTMENFVEPLEQIALFGSITHRSACHIQQQRQGLKLISFVVHNLWKNNLAHRKWGASRICWSGSNSLSARSQFQYDSSDLCTTMLCYIDPSRRNSEDFTEFFQPLGKMHWTCAATWVTDGRRTLPLHFVGMGRGCCFTHYQHFGDTEQ